MAVTTDKLSYVNKENVSITVTVTDGTNLVGGVAVHVALTTANGRLLGGNGTTNNDGVAKFRYKVNSGRDGVGPYTVDADSTKTGYDPGSGSIPFEVTR